MSIELKPLKGVEKEQIIDLMNHPLVCKHMPLLNGPFGEEEYQKFIAIKEAVWKEHGYGPWAFYQNKKFVGWGGLQPVDDDAEIAIVLHPDHWGLGKELYEKIIQYAFREKQLDSVIVLFPPTRKCIRSIIHLGFKPDGEDLSDGEEFIRYRRYDLDQT